MEIEAIEAAVEAILFASGDGVPADRIAAALELDRGTVTKILGLMMEKSGAPGRGVALVREEDAYQFVTKPEYAGPIRRTLDFKRNVPLTQAAMEVLSIVAYNQPVTRGYIEQVRGVDSSGIVANLCDKGLVEERGRLDVPGRPILFGTTNNFLRCFGLASLRELPQVERLAQGEEAAVQG